MPATNKKEAKLKSREARYDYAVSRLNDLPTIPSTLLRIWQMVDSPDCSASDLEKAITMDQALTAKVLRLVNSPYYGVRRKITSCQRAVTLLGFNTIKSLSICVSVISALRSKKGQGGALDCPSLWKHSISAAVIAKSLAELSKLDDPDTIFTAGVLHDVGKFVMNLCLSGEYAAVITVAKREGLFIRDVEEKMLGADHTYFGAYLGRKWGFPQQLLSAIENHHSKEASDSGDLVGAVSLADHLARSMKFGDSGDSKEILLDTSRLCNFGIMEEETSSFLDRVRERVLAAHEFMNLL